MTNRRQFIGMLSAGVLCGTATEALAQASGISRATAYAFSFQGLDNSCRTGSANRGF